MVYIGQTRAKALTKRLAEFGFGECCVREEFPPRRNPWFLDNGAFKDWKAGRQFDDAKWSACLAKVRASSLRPDFVVAPDDVGGGWSSLNRSRSWMERLRDIGNVYLAVQDGMDYTVVADPFDGIFVGGSLAWKLRTGAGCVGAAHSHGKPCHIGRVGTMDRVIWAREIGADSIDSCLPLWSEANLERFLQGFVIAEPKVRAADAAQLELVCMEESP